MGTPASAQSGGTDKSFSIKDCALIALATGKKARLLQELRSEIAVIDAASIYYHYWGGLLHPRFEEREFNNDFAAWVQHGMHDAVLAERLAVLSPTSFDNLELVRQAIIDLIDQRMDEVEHLFWARATTQFEFILSQIVVFDTTQRLQQPRDLAAAISTLSTSSIFYHFIDARRRTPERRDDFSDWLALFGDEFMPLREKLTGIDPYFSSLSELRLRLSEVLNSHFEANPQ